MSKEDEDRSMKRIGIGLVIISAFVAAICIYAIWMGLSS